jgi:crossover junction endodeoxyribonuclease RuvC
MRVLGIDPGSRRTGYGVIEVLGRDMRAIAFGVLPGLGDSLPARLLAIGTALDLVFDSHAPDLVSVEQAFHAKNPRSTLILGQVRGLALWLAVRRGLPIHEFAPRSVKLSITGQGGAGKPQVAAMVRRLLALDAAPAADAADALAIALCCARRAGLDRVAARPHAKTARAADGAVVDLARAFAPVRRRAEAKALAGLVELGLRRRPR